MQEERIVPLIGTDRNPAGQSVKTGIRGFRTDGPKGMCPEQWRGVSHPPQTATGPKSRHAQLAALWIEEDYIQSDIIERISVRAARGKRKFDRDIRLRLQNQFPGLGDERCGAEDQRQRCSENAVKGQINSKVGQQPGLGYVGCRHRIMRAI